MRDIVFYDFNFNRLAVFPRYISMNFDKIYCGFGSAELHFSTQETGVLELLTDNPYMFFSNGEHFAVVTGWRIAEDIAVFGRTPEWLLTKRGVKPMTKTSVTPETIAREAVADAAGDFVATGTFLGIGTKISYSTKKVRVLYDVVCEVLKKENLGFKVVPDLTLKKFVFSVYKGKETDVLVSLSGRTAYDMQYTAEKQDLITKSGWYERKLTDMGDWDAINNKPELSNNSFTNAFKFYRIISESYTASGNKIREFGLWCQKGWYLYSVSESGLWEISETKPESVWLYINNGGMTGAKKWDAVLSGTLTKEEAENELLKMTGQETIDSELKGIEYGKDYTLGDILRVQFEFGDFKRTLSKRVYGINVYCDIDKSGIKPVLKSLEV